MFQFLTKRGRTAKRAARDLYAAILKQSRNPVFYTHFAVPDTVDGRFEMIALHCGLLVDRLYQKDVSPNDRLLAQSLFDAMFLNLDWSCREMGIGDLGVPRHMKRLMAAFKGRAFAYGEATRSGRGATIHALTRNAYGTCQAVDSAVVESLATYVDSLVYSLHAQAKEDIQSGRITFPAIEDFIGAAQYAQRVA